MANRQKLGGAKDAVDDLVMLDQVKDDEIIKNLRNRYASDQIYTNIGPVLVAINPFKMIPRLFTEAKIREYRGKKFYEMPPHVYALADDAYRKMLGFHENQCIIISGESGSGKTETSKLIMQYISSVSGKSAEVQRVKDRMLSSNPLLEAFGNAKTVNNNNSSRFGKYMEILFDFGGDPVGGRVTNYLLEKSRVVGPAMNERNFHVFYQITMGASDAEREQYCLYGPEAYWYLSQSQCLTVDGIDDIKDFKEMTDAMVVMGLTEQDRAEVFRVISSILWLGNLQFEENHNEESKVSDPQVLEICAALLQVQSAALEKSICTRMIQTGAGARTENFCKPLPAKQASFSRDTLAKALYSRMFDWLVARVNDSIKKPDFKGVMIGVLDIYGFEIFQFNSFEQLCINFVNERLQQIFIELTLKAEQDEYRSEGIPWQEVEYYNNKPLCDLIESTPGLLSIMDDCCNTAKTDQMFVQDVGRYFSGNQAIFCGSNDFSIRHYAGDVRYEAEGFLQKNKDTLFDDLIQVIQSSPCQFVRDHGWAEIQVSTGQKKRPVTVGFAFKQQVQALMAALKACEPHYIRCIKPNMQKTPNNFNDANIKRQVQYLGLLENIRVRRAGYATRHPYATFVKRYKLLSRDVLAKRVHGDERVLCQAILSGIGFREGQEYAMGRTKVFIRHATAVFHLEDMIERKMNEAVIVIQKAYRKYKKKRYYLEMRAKAYDVVNNRKERRRGSIKMDYRGDYLNFTYNNLVGGLLQATGKREKVVFADRAKNIILRGKRSFFERIASAFKTEDQFEHRFLLLSDEALYSLTFLQDPQTNKTKVELYFRIPYNQIQSVTVSPYQDNFVIIHFAPSAGKTDILASVRHKTELLGLLVHNFKLKTNGQLNVQFLQTDSISVGDNKLVVVTWVKDELANEEKLMPVKHNVEIHICSGVPPSQVPAPFRPAEIDSSVPARPSLRALYDFKGNGVDELSFKKDDIIFVIAEEDGGWYNGELNGQKGFVPSNYVERIQRQAVAKPQPAAAAKPPPPAAALPVKCDWQELTTDDGMVYYWNNVSGESRWEKPAEMVAFERTHKPSISKPTVVAPQVQKCSAPGCSNDVFGGKNVCITHAKKEEKQPVAVAQPQVKVQAAVIKPQIQAAPVAAVANKPPAPATPAPSRTGFGTVQPRGPAAAAAVAQARPAMPAAAGARPEMKMVMPAAAAQPRPSPTAQQTPLSPRSAAAAAVARPAQVAQPQAQPGGFRLPVANQQPAAAVARPAAAATPARPAQAFKPPVPAAQPKKSAWTAQYDPASGATYYYNTETGASQWEKPADM